MMKQKFKNKKYHSRGFAAILVSVIVASILVVLIFTENSASFFARFDALGSEWKRISLGLSESCQNTALLKIAQDYNYDVNADSEYIEDEGVKVSVGKDECFIRSVETTNAPRPECDASPLHKCLKIITGAQYPATEGAWTKNQAIILLQNPTTPTMTSPISIISWQEI